MLLCSVIVAAAALFAPQTASSAATSSVDFEFFKTRVQPIFLARRPGHARCYVCHSAGAGGFRLQRLSPGAETWSDEQSRLNFAAVQREVTPGKPDASMLLLRPLAAEAGGLPFHSGGKHWDSKSNPEWQTLSEWVRGEKTTGSK
jgi:hypothetical protein